MRREQLAINSVSTRQGSLEEALDAYAAAGFTNVEFTLGAVKEYVARGHAAGDVRAMLADRGLRSVGGFETGLACFAQGEGRERNHATVLANARLVHDLGGGTLVFGTDGPEGRPSVEALDTVAEAVADLAARTEGLDVALALEFNWSPLVKSLMSALRVVRAVGNPRVGILFDPAHYHCTSTKFEHLTAEAVGFVKHVHLNDMRDKPGELSDCNADRVLPGDGVLDLPALIGRLEGHGYRGLFSIEMFSADLWALPAAEAARRCYQSLLPLCR